MNTKTITILAIISIFLCGCPALASLCFGAWNLILSLNPQDIIDTYQTNSLVLPIALGVGSLFLGLGLAAVPVGLFIYRRRQAARVSGDDPIPPPC